MEESTVERRACVLGAGIGGLAAALGLVRGGWRVEVLERAPDLRASGGGIGLTPNGVLALRELGVADAVRARSVVQVEGGVRGPGGRWIARHRLDFVARRYGESIRAMPRIDLLRALADALPPGCVRFAADARPVSFGGPDDPAVVRVDEQDSAYDLVVGADGIRSVTRTALHPEHPGLRDCGAVSWRAIVPDTGLRVAAAETWGAGLRFSVLPLPGGRVHFSALVLDRLVRGSTGGPVELFGGWHDPVPELLRRAFEDGEVHRDRIEELAGPLPAYSRGRVVLLGDAAHPMTPNVGSANLALEDAVELGVAVAAVASWPDLADGLACYDAARRPRAERLSRTSRWMGRVAEASWKPLVVARTGGVWLGGFLPEVVSRRSMDRMVGWRPPLGR
ncbi:MAG: FAD-dependent monooxygenase [Umezawaea sp.]